MDHHQMIPAMRVAWLEPATSIQRSALASHCRMRFVQARLCLLPAIAAVALLASGEPAFAELKIPNPLLQPSRNLLPATGQAAAEASDKLPVPPAPLPFSAATGQEKDDLKDIRAQFGAFRVSAILGREAVLRQTANKASAQAALSGSAGGFGGTSPAAPGASPDARSETLLLIDGEAIEFVGTAVRLIPRITASRVLIYYVDSTKTGKDEPKHHPVVFIGEVSSSETIARSAPILERPDSSYKQSISVQSTSKAQSATANGAPPQPATLPAP